MSRATADTLPPILGASIGGGLPLQIVRGIWSATGEWDYVINHPAGTGAGGAASRRTGREAFEGRTGATASVGGSMWEVWGTCGHNKRKGGADE